MGAVDGRKEVLRVIPHLHRWISSYWPTINTTAKRKAFEMPSKSPVMGRYGARCCRGTRTRFDDSLAPRRTSVRTPTFSCKLQPQTAAPQTWMNRSRLRTDEHTYPSHSPENDGHLVKLPDGCCVLGIRMLLRVHACVFVCAPSPRIKRNSHLSRDRLTMKHQAG